MKKLLKTISLLTSLIGTTFSFLNCALLDSVETNAVSLASSINLNDNSEQEIRNYYSDLNGLDESELRGTNLLKNLKKILRKNFCYYDYDDVWQIYEITDRDWSLSPASSDVYATYDSATNSYSSYTYGTSTSNSKNNPYIHAIYREQGSENRLLRAWDDHTSSNNDGVDNGYLNREHIWPQSYGFKASTGALGPAGTDVHHLVAADGPVNSSLHNNNIYGFVDTSKTYTSGEETRGTENNKKGQSIHYDVNNVVFEPIDENKGDIARATFYMCAMYNSYDETEPSSYNPNLALSNKDVFSESRISSSKSVPAEYGLLNDLLAWNYMDDVDEYESHRNNLIYNNYQYNRNPFVDFPQWADLIWGDKNKEGYYACPSTDVIGGVKNNDYVVLTHNELTLPLSSTQIITATSNANSISISEDDPNNVINTSITDKTITITSDSNNIGTAIITITTGKSSTTCLVTVTNSIILDKEEIYLNSGETASLSASEEVSWSVNNSLLTLSATTGQNINISSSEVENDIDVIITASKEGKYSAICIVHVLAETFNDESAQIIFPSHTKSSDNNSSISKWNTSSYPFLSGFKYLSISTEETEKTKFSNVYYGKNGYGLKLGTSSSSGSLTIELNQAAFNGLNISSIDVSTSAWTSSSGTADKDVAFNVSTYSNDTLLKQISFDPSVGGTIDFDSPSLLTKIIFSTSKLRAYLKSVTFNFYSIESFGSDFRFLTDDICNYSKNNNWVDISESLSTIWTDAKTKYNYLSDTQKNKVIETVASENSDATSIQKAMGRYDHIISRYESTSIDDFIGRNRTNNKVNLIYNDNNFNISLIVAIAIFSVSICLFIYVVKKHKRG